MYSVKGGIPWNRGSFLLRQTIVSVSSYTTSKIHWIDLNVCLLMKIYLLQYLLNEKLALVFQLLLTKCTFNPPHLQVDVLVSSAGGVEEDFIKCLAPTFLGDFRLPGKDLRLKGINRIGNLLVPNDNYVKFEEWIMPIFDQMLEDQKRQVCMLQ